MAFNKIGNYVVHCSLNIQVCETKLRILKTVEDEA